jgi:hypothetical protein
MTDRTHWWNHAAKMLSRSGLLWLALTAIALGSLVSSGAGLAPSARLVAASTPGSASKLKTNGPGAPTVIPGELSRAVSHRAQSPEAAARRVLAGGTPVGLLAADAFLFAFARMDDVALGTIIDPPTFRPSPFAARAPPAHA